MINYKTEPELQRILSEFDVPELTFTGRKDAGPDEELYFFKDASGTKYGVWARDYMSNLKYETVGLKNNFGITVRSWLNLRDGQGQTLEHEGDIYAVFVMTKV